ncbi:GNAT family N-acetyltransferase [Massilia sp. TS11]|uniref:GNAT family N-acetyltransferase n=1 Tax=Massilia sp. TS11 TaxID=2908003 RepID=UPI001EDBEB6A|nr:GNAT family N-acyltransferase [Massilia sp. TS11]MCG2584280.1 GNAT family N-acetyltransferase [Massilia sp. TS11]
MEHLITSGGLRAASPKLTISLASTEDEVREVQRLRYQVFIEDMGLSALANPERLDRDEFDAVCDHLLVRESESLRVVGTYRLLNPAAARRLGRLYSENEFDLGRLNHIRARLVEAGRACIHPDFRGGSVIMLLWSGLADYMRRQQCDFLVGCASISLADGGHNAIAVYQQLCGSHLAPHEYRVTPHLPFPVEQLAPAPRAQVPSLLKGYMRSGAWVGGAPAWDPDFESADLFVMMPMANLDTRVSRHYGI